MLHAKNWPTICMSKGKSRPMYKRYQEKTEATTIAKPSNTHRRRTRHWMCWELCVSWKQHIKHRRHKKNMYGPESEKPQGYSNTSETSGHRSARLQSCASIGQLPSLQWPTPARRGRKQPASPTNYTSLTDGASDTSCGSLWETTLSKRVMRRASVWHSLGQEKENGWTCTLAAKRKTGKCGNGLCARRGEAEEWRKTWRHTARADLREMGVSWHGARRVTSDWTKWRGLVAQ